MWDTRLDRDTYCTFAIISHHYIAPIIFTVSTKLMCQLTLQQEQQVDVRQRLLTRGRCVGVTGSKHHNTTP